MADIDVIIERLERQSEEIRRLTDEVSCLKKVMVNHKAWIPPDIAAEMVNKTIKYLVDYKDSLGLVYSRSMKKGKILFETRSILEFLERNSNRRYLSKQKAY